MPDKKSLIPYGANIPGPTVPTENYISDLVEAIAGKQLQDGLLPERDSVGRVKRIALADNGNKKYLAFKEIISRLGRTKPPQKELEKITSDLVTAGVGIQDLADLWVHNYGSDHRIGWFFANGQYARNLTGITQILISTAENPINHNRQIFEPDLIKMITTAGYNNQEARKALDKELSLRLQLDSKL